MSEILLPELKRSTVQIKIVGDSPLIVHRWSEKAKKEMGWKGIGNKQDSVGKA